MSAEDRLERVRRTAKRLRELGNSAVETVRLLQGVAFAGFEGALRFEQVASENEDLRGQLATMAKKLETKTKRTTELEDLLREILRADGLWSLTEILKKIRDAPR